MDFLADLGRLALFADLPASELEAILLAHPVVMYRILKAEARRLATASEWPTCATHSPAPSPATSR